MSLIKDAPLRELYHSDEELMHWKYVKKEKRSNGKWRYYYDAEQLIGAIGRIDRYLEAGKAWIDSRLDRSIADIVKGTRKPLSWQQAKERVDSAYRYGDKKKLLTDKYRD